MGLYSEVGGGEKGGVHTVGAYQRNLTVCLQGTFLLIKYNTYFVIPRVPNILKAINHFCKVNCS